MSFEMNTKPMGGPAELKAWVTKHPGLSFWLVTRTVPEFK